MTDRRTFLKCAAVMVAAQAMAGGGAAFAGGHADMAGIIYYTADKPGRWKGKSGGHAPVDTVEPPVATVEKGKITVETKHGMSEAHYIVRHVVIQSDGTVLGEKAFKPTDKAISSFDLPVGFKGKLYITSFWNLHDLWLT